MSISPYRLIKTLNERYEVSYPTQMGYNYVRNNLIESYKDDDGKIQIEDEVAETFISKFASKNNLVER